MGSYKILYPPYLTYNPSETRPQPLQPYIELLTAKPAPDVMGWVGHVGIEILIL